MRSLHWDKVAAADSAEAWVFRVAFNLRASWFRRGRRTGSGVALLPEHGMRDPDPVLGVLLTEVIRSLPRRQREALVLRHVADLSVRDAAEAMGCAEGTVRALTAQAVSTMRERLGTDVEEREADD